MRDDINRYLPLSESTYYVLLALLEPLHGYGVMQKVGQLSEGAVTVGPGTLYIDRSCWRCFSSHRATAWRGSGPPCPV